MTDQTRTPMNDPLDLRSYGIKDLDEDGTQEWLDRIGGILGDNFAHFAKTNPTGIVRSISHLLIRKERELAAVEAKLRECEEDAEWTRWFRELDPISYAELDKMRNVK